MANQFLAGRRALITHADQFMGPALCDSFRRHGAEVIADTSALLTPDAPAALIAGAGDLDILVINLALKAPTTPLDQIEDSEWQAAFQALVDPLPRLVRAVVPTMKAKKRGKILVMGSASALRGMKNCATYSAARGAQLAYVQEIGRAQV